ncbi:MAG: TonB-dependent receptor, partial [Bacteroidota bacterium]
MFRFFTLLFLLLTSFQCFAQSGGVKGYVKDGTSGNEIDNVNIVLMPGYYATTTNAEGYFSINRVPPGNYTLSASMVGYDSMSVKIVISADKTINQIVYLEPFVFNVGGGKIEVYNKKKKEDVDVGTTRITNKQLAKIPTVGGTPDLVQYLQILPGVVFSGDQGGQLYIRGGSPVMNKVLLDGMTIYNPFHSIGLFSVFDADLIKSADVYSAGFGVEYGGRVSAVVDVKTKDGDRKKIAGNFAISPFLGKVSIEGPLKKFKPNKGSSSFIVSIKNSYLDKSSKVFYDYANPDKLPYSFNDVYAKMSFNSSNGSNLKVFGFNFRDRVNFPGTTSYGWNQSGFGTRFTMIPEGKQSKIDGFLTYSNYLIEQKEKDNKPRSSGINGFNVGLTATSYNSKDEIKYGFEINGFRTQFNIYNANNRRIEQDQYTT